MPDLETRMPDLLRRAAAGLRADDAFERRTLRRARRRRARNASAAALAAIALAAGLALGARTVLTAGLTPADGADGALPTSSVSPTPSPGSPVDEGLPTPVRQTRDAILAAIEARDFAALETLIDPDRFAYNFSDGHDPVPEWRRDPAPLEALAAILRMPFATREGTPELGTVYVWPSLVDADLTNLTDEERAMLTELGISEREVRRMLEAFGAYVGPRTGIAQDGTWVFSTLGGD
ncbi:MAG: hypothetical protein KatS3mg014_0461 [Actinomycetota bacterium]|nr:MAG: hypothetical protein KatS3mg014_0461 [Actinomycetota bacterium]